MIRTFIDNWWLLALRGVFALLFAILIFSLQPLSESFFIRPIIHAGVIVVFALLALAAGVSTIAAALYRSGNHRSNLLLGDGIAVSVTALIILLAPRLELTVVVLAVAIWAVVLGILELLIARTLRRHIPDEWSLSLAGIGSLVLGAYCIFEHNSEPDSLVRWIGIYSAFSALTILSLALRLHGFRSSVHHVSRAASPQPRE